MLAHAAVDRIDPSSIIMRARLLYFTHYCLLLTTLTFNQFTKCSLRIYDLYINNAQELVDRLNVLTSVYRMIQKQYVAPVLYGNNKISKTSKCVRPTNNIAFAISQQKAKRLETAKFELRWSVFWGKCFGSLAEEMGIYSDAGNGEAQIALLRYQPYGAYCTRDSVIKFKDCQCKSNSKDSKSL